jgi:tetratricopeptide (TPR) repeat protein
VAVQPGPPLLSGTVPPPADYYHPRAETAPDLAAGLRPGQVVVLTHGEHTAAAPATQGGTGKTQLAIEFAHAIWQAGAVEVLVWTTAASREAIVTSFAQAAASVGAADSDEEAEVAAARFVAWLAHTRRRWALVIDDLADMAHLSGLWPSGPAGQVVITTRLPGTVLNTSPVLNTGPIGNTGATANTPSGDLTIVPLSGFSRREALSYLNSRLTDYPDQRIEALDLGEDLDGLPLGLTHASSVIKTRGQTCREYRALLAERRTHMSGVSAGGLSPEILATWSLAAECAHELQPEGLAWPALALAAMLDPHGIPGAVLTSQAACGYITGRPPVAADQSMVRAAITNLAKVGLVSIDPAAPAQTVRMHPSVQTAVRAYLPGADLERVMLAAADALVQTWPETGGPQLDQAMRDCTAALCAVAGTDPLRAAAGASPLWKPEAHPLLFRTGVSLEDSRLADSAITYWQSMITTSTRLLGPAHANAIIARDRLGAAYELAGQADDAIAVFMDALADRERNQGPEHPETIAARGQLARAYQSAGRPADAVAVYERMAADSSRHFGAAHPSTQAARTSLAAAYQAAGMMKEAVAAYQLLLTDSARLLGAGHPATLAVRNSLAAAYEANGRPKDAIDHYKRVLAGHEGTRGRDHPDTIAARANLASALRRAKKPKDAVALYERVLADRERVDGADHPDTIAACANLAFAYRSAGLLREAIPAYERTLADRERVQGSDHRDTRTARSNLAAAYQQAERLTDAIPQYERVLADSERMLGPGDLETLTARCSLASAHYADGRLMEVVALLQRALADSELYLGQDHPMTKTVRQNLDAATRT